MPAQGAPAWSVAYEVDFRALANQSLMTDTTHTIGDRVWTKTDSVDAQQFEIQNTVGLVMRCSTQTSQMGPPFTTQLANIAIRLGTLIENYDPHRDYIFQMHITANNADVGTTVILNGSVGVSLFIGGLLNAPQGSSNRGLFITQRSQTAGAGPWSYNTLFNSTSITSSTDFPITAYNTVCIANQGHGNENWMCSVGNRTGDDWPEQSSLRPYSTGDDASGGQVDSHNDPVDNWLGIGVAAGLGNNTGTFSATVAGLRVLVKDQRRRIRLTA